MNRCKWFSKIWFLGLLLVAFVAGCANNGDETPIIADTTPPTVTVTSPTDKSPAVPINRKISVAFSESMVPASFSSESFTLKETGTTGNLLGTFVPADTSVVFTPDSLLTTNTDYTVTVKGGISGGVKDLAGNAMVNDYVFTFKTGLTADATAPTIISTGAFDGEEGLPVNRASTATFSEPMDPTTLVSPATSFTVCATASQVGPCVTPVVGVVTYLGNTATFNPDSDLSANTWYMSTITDKAEDLAGIALISGLKPNPWYWKTGAELDTVAPKIISTNPMKGVSDVPVDKKISATFDEPMNPATMITANFTVQKTGPPLGTPILGTVAYDVENKIVTFSPQSNLEPATNYTAMVTSDAKDLAGNALLVPALDGLNQWTFTTAPASVPLVPLAINLRGAESFGIASRAGMTSTGITRVNGDVALYPTALCTDSTGGPGGAEQTCLVKTYASPTGMTVNGSIYFAGDPFDNGGTANSVSNDLNIAWIEGKNKVNTQAVGYLGGELGGKTIFPGVYEEASTLLLSVGTVATLDAQGDANAVFIFKVGSSLTDYGILSNKTRIDLINGAQARNVWFITGVSATIGSGTIWNGNILAGSTITVNSDSKVLGRLLSGADLSGGLLTLINDVAAPAITTVTVPE